jgi:hypothetical protein
MKLRRLVLLLPVVTLSLAEIRAAGKEKKPPAPTGWCYAAQDSVDAKPSPSGRKKIVARLGRGALLPVFDTKRRGDGHWTRVQVVDPAKLTAEKGWVESSKVQSLPLSQFPTDAELLKILGGSYLEDYTTRNAAIARYLVRQGDHEPALVCFVGSPMIPQARLQVFLRTAQGFALGPFLEFPFSDMQAGITFLEVRDLLGDGNECLVSRESFNAGPENHGINMLIRRLEGEAFKLLWKAPVEYRNLASYPPKPQTLTPPEKNIGAPGTVTKGDVEFRARGRIREPLWKGKIEFHAVGRDEPVETIDVEKACAWDGAKFAPLP